jgi:xanthine dehydrogenase YagT iron-sulfur-binding subunit
MSDASDSLPMTRRGFLQSALAAAAVAEAPYVLAAQPMPAASAEVFAIPEAPPQPVRLNVNGKDYTLQLEPRVTLLDALRETIGLTGAKKGCDRGQCGACTVLLDGRRVNACLTLAIMAEGRQVITIEGLAKGEQLSPMQAAFLEYDAFQCGYCTPGQICSATALLREPGLETLNDDAIRERMSGNLCRCGAYPNIVLAIRSVAKRA